MSAFRMYLRVLSPTLQPEEISRRLGVAPDSSDRRGSRRRPQAPPFAESRWIRLVVVPEGGARPEDLESVVVGWGMDFARSLGRLVEEGEASASLEIVQEIRNIDSSAEKGIFLGQELLMWLAAARASLDIDQYIYHECSPTGLSVDSEPDDDM